MTAELVTFLRARLDEDERAAQAVRTGDRDWSGRWEFDDDWEEARAEGFAGQLVDGGLRVANVGEQPHRKAGGLREVDARHIARHAPARVLAEVQAKRRIIDEHDGEGSGTCPICYSVGFEHDPCQTLRLLALPYASHPDYRAEWSPTEEDSRG